MSRREACYSLVIFASREKLFLTLIKKEQLLVASATFDLNNDFVEIFFEKLTSFLEKQQIDFADLQKIYAGVGPGSYLINRAIVTFLKTSKILNSYLEIFVINNLLFQIGLKSKVISLIDANKRHFYLMNSDDPKKKVVLWSKAKFTHLVQKYPDYQIYQNFLGFDHWLQLQTMINHFQHCPDWKKIKAIQL